MLQAGRRKAKWMPLPAIEGIKKTEISGFTLLTVKACYTTLCFMARLTGEFKFTGTIDGLCFYKMYGDYFVRIKSSLTGKRFWKDKVFEGSRKSCDQLAKASHLASRFYKTYAKEWKKRGLFNEMTGRVKLWLKEGKTEEEALLMLVQFYAVKQKPIRQAHKQHKKAKRVHPKKRDKLFIVLTNTAFVHHWQSHTARKPYCLKE